MHRRPRLKEAIEMLQQLSAVSEDAAQTLADYYTIKAQGNEFGAARLVVEVVDYYYHLSGVQEIAHG